MDNDFVGLMRNRFNNAGVETGSAEVLFKAAVGDPQFSGLHYGDQNASFGDNYVLNAIDPRLMLLGANGVYEDADPSAANGFAGDVITEITANLPGFFGNGTVSALAYGGSRDGTGYTNVAFVGTNSGQLFFRGESGATFTLADTFSSGITSIAVDPRDWRRVYVIAGNRLEMTNDVTRGANSFIDITGNLDLLTANQFKSITLYSDNTAIVPIIGGFGGVYVPTSGSAVQSVTWTQLGKDLPNTLVDDVGYVRGSDLLTAATFGRGAWTLANVSAAIGPLVTVPSPVSLSENGSVAFSTAQSDAITVADVAATTNSDLLTLKVSHGKLKLASTTGLSFSSGSNNSASMTIKGTLANLGAALNGLKFTPTSGFSGSASLSILLKDSGNNVTASATVAISVNPFITAPASATVQENTMLTFSSISLTDGGVSGTSDSLSLSVTNGTLQLSSTNGLTFVSGANRSASMTIKGTLANLNSAMKGLKFTPATDFTGSVSLTMTLANFLDGLGVSAIVPIAVSAPPTISAPASASVTENSGFTFSSANGDPITFTDAAAPPGAFDNVKLTVSRGKLLLGSPGSIALLAGANNSASMTIKGTLPNLATALNGLVYTPNSNFVGSDSLTIMITDAGDSLSASRSIVLTIQKPPTPNPASTTSAPSNAISGTTSAQASDPSNAWTTSATSTTSGSVIFFGQGAKDVVNERSELRNRASVLHSPAADSIETDLNDEAIQWAGLTDAVDVLNA
jgi:hypothetical protein